MSDFLRILFTPRCWLQNHFHSGSWDAELRRALREDRFTKVSEHTAEIAGFTVWISNHPYASFTTYGNGPRVRPSRGTILQAWDKLQLDRFRKEDPNGD